MKTNEYNISLSDPETARQHKFLQLNQQARKLLSSCPKRPATGIHEWLFIAARILHRSPFFLKPEKIKELLGMATGDCGRVVSEHEIQDAVNHSDLDFIPPQKSPHPRPSGKGKSRRKCAYNSPLPARRWDRREKIIKASTVNLFTLLRDSPIKCCCFVPLACLPILYPDKPLLCFAWDIRHDDSSTWDNLGIKAPDDFPPLLVPTPLLGEWALTLDSKPSARALANIGKRRYLVIEFDSGCLNDQAKLVYHLRDSQMASESGIGLVLIMFSGKKSLHSWWWVNHLDEKQIIKFFNYAYTLGADHATKGKQQLVRVPGAKRPDTGCWQQLYYLDPAAINFVSNTNNGG